jgi:DNA-binding GntR family transcriptional regulator
VTTVELDWLDESQLEDLRRELASMTDAALARTYETYRRACGLLQDGIPHPATMQHFWEVWEECRRRLEQLGFMDAV